ncbi:hypothetical protein OAL29_00895 [Candidatus Binatia bacterium]|nr:hypothetical protein [Candidatus Binatia bacterium]
MAKSKSRKLADFISDSAIDTAELADGSISTAKIADDAVSPAKVDSTGTYSVANLGIGAAAPSEPLHIEPTSGNADILLRKYGSGDDARIFIKRKDNTGRAYISYTNEDTVDTWYGGLLRNNNNNLVLGSRSDDYGLGVILMDADSSMQITRFGSDNPDTTDTATHRKLEIRANGTSASTSGGNYRRDCFVQQTTGNNQYNWYKLRIGSGIYGRGANVKYTITWTTGHASGNGLVDGSFTVRARHDNSKNDVSGHVVYNRAYQNGTYYGFSANPDMTLFSCDATESNAGVYLRVEGYRSSGYDGNLIHSIYVEIFGSTANTGDQGIAFVGTSTPSDAGGSISRNILN